MSSHGNWEVTHQELLQWGSELLVCYSHTYVLTRNAKFLLIYCRT